MKEEKDAVVGASHDLSCQWGGAGDKAGLLCVPRLGSCAGFLEGRRAFIRGGGEAAAGPGPSPELAGQLEANRKVQ